MFMMTFENVHDDIQSRHARHRHVILGLDSSYLAPTRHAWPQDVMPGPDRASFLLQRLGRIGTHEAEGL